MRNNTNSDFHPLLKPDFPHDNRKWELSGNHLLYSRHVPSHLLCCLPWSLYCLFFSNKIPGMLCFFFITCTELVVSRVINLSGNMLVLLKKCQIIHCMCKKYRYYYNSIEMWALYCSSSIFIQKKMKSSLLFHEWRGVPFRICL